MKKIILVALSLALVACDRAPQEDARTDSAPQLTTSGAPVEESVVVDEIEGVISDVSGQAALNLRYDRPRNLDGKIERQVYVEMLGPTSEQTESLAVAAFEAAGFTTRRGLDDANGVRLQFRKTGSEHINALIRDQAASPPFENPAGTSSLYLRQVQKD